MSRIKSLFLISLPVFFIVASCKSRDTDPNGKVNPGTLYFDYRVWGDEESGDITVKLQYRVFGPGGQAVLVPGPGKVELDGELIHPDSTKMSGVYYEISKPVKGFAGKHTIIFTNSNDRQYKEEFSFNPISLKSDVPPVINRSDLVFELDGLAQKDFVKVIMTDTASFSEGIVRTDTIINGSLLISRRSLGRLTDGPIYFEIMKEEDRRIRNATKRGGRLSISYGLKREFILAQ